MTYCLTLRIGCFGLNFIFSTGVIGVELCAREPGFVSGKVGVRLDASLTVCEELWVMGTAIAGSVFVGVP